MHQIRLGGFDEQMVVIGHQHPRVNPPPGQPAGLAQSLEKEAPVIIVEKDRLPPIPPCHDVVVSAWMLDPEPWRREANIISVNICRLTTVFHFLLTAFSWKSVVAIAAGADPVFARSARASGVSVACGANATPITLCQEIGNRS